ncbi:MAG: hypothetical protein GX911_00160 [Spirochaetales bacterium]|nr:hypothetical protein [Spirochaetales bacterium]
MKQGDIIDIGGLAIDCLPEDTSYCLVITHSCDLARTTEHTCEIIPCVYVPTYDGNKTNGKNHRELHFRIDDNWYSVKAKDKRSIEKDSVSCLHPVFSLEEQMLQNWLSFRYRRQALPDEVNTLLFKRLKLYELVKKHGEHLLGVWTSMNHDEDIRTGEDIGYSIDVLFVFDALEDADEACQNKFEEEYEKYFKKSGIDSKQITSYFMGDDIFTYREARTYSFVNFDYLSNN